MAYGEIKVDTITFTDGGVDKSISISGLVQNPTFSGNITVTGTISGGTLLGQTISGVTVTGTTAAFTSGTFTSLTGGVFTATSGVFALGAASAPSITFTGDLNTGIYSPGADQVAISTNGTERIRVSSAGLLLLKSANSFIGVDTEDGADTSTLLIGGGGAASVSRGAYLWVKGNENTDAGALVLAAGNVGTAPITAVTGGSERLRITSDGKLGLGTSAPSVKLEVKSPSSATNVLQVTPTTGSGYFRVRETGGNDIDVRLADAAGTESVLINSDGSSYFNGGNVGIGTTSPGYILETAGDIRINPPSGNAVFRFGRAGSDDWAIYNDTSDNLVFYSDAGGAERVRIDSSGRLLIGTSTSRTADGYASGLQLEGTTNYQSASISLTHNRADTGAPEFRFCKSRGTSAGAVTLVNSGDILGRLYFYGTDGSAAIQAARISAEVDGTPGTNDMPGRIVFATTADGASTSTERMRISQNGVVTIKNGAVAEIGTLTDGATITPNFAANCNFTVTLGGNRTIANPTNITAGQSGSIFLVQDATGSRTLSWGSYWDFSSGTAPTLSTTANAVDRIDYIVRSATSIHTVFTSNYS
jgi:hypothetical protein